jgi:hypothetical protein
MNGKDFAKEFASRGGRARAEQLTANERRAIASKAGKASAKKKKKARKKKT